MTNKLSTTWKLSDETVQKVDAATSALETELSELRDRWNDKSETWQESDEGNEVLSWIDEWQNVIDTTDDLTRAAEAP